MRSFLGGPIHKLSLIQRLSEKAKTTNVIVEEIGNLQREKSYETYFLSRTHGDRVYCS